MNAAQILKSIRYEWHLEPGPVRQVLLRADTARRLLGHPVYSPVLQHQPERLSRALFHGVPTVVQLDLDVPYLLIRETARRSAPGVAVNLTGGRE